MKRLTGCLFILLYLSLPIFSTQAQGLYASLSGGYHAKLAGSPTFNASGYQVDVRTYSLGKGWSGEVGLGYFFSEYVGVEMGYNYLRSYKLVNDLRGIYSIDQINQTDHQAGMHRLIPSLVLTAGNGKLKPYAKLGAVITTGTITYHYEQAVTGPGGIYELNEQTWEYSKGINLGARAVAGATLGLTSKLDFLTELSLISLSYGPKKGTLIRSSSNGKDNLKDYSAYGSEIEFVDELYLPASPSQPIDPNMARKDLRHFYPFSSIGLNVGLRYRF